MSRRQSLTVAATATAVLALTACGQARGTPPATQGTPIRLGALVVTAPHGFSRRVIHGHEELLGVLLTNYRVAPGSLTLTQGVFPASGVVVSVARGALLSGALPPLQLPLNLAELREQRHPNGTAWNGEFRFHGWLYAISFWLGRTSPPHDQAAAKNALSSIRKAPPLK